MPRRPVGKPAEDAIHETLQQNLHHGGEALLTGWAVVAEFTDGERRTLVRLWPAQMTPWGAKSLWHEALYGDWSEE